MLCRRDDFIWKIADFGLSLQGTSDRDQTSEYVRESASYRAPELVKESGKQGDANYKCTNKIDIWAFGCVVFEVLTHKRAFCGEEGVLTYVLSDGKPSIRIAVVWKSIREATRRILSELTLAMLQISENSRPGAHDILHVLRSFTIWSRGFIWTSNCRHYIGRNDFVDILAAQWSSTIWRTVKWLPCRFYPF